jgi:hypothetical protein
MLKLGAEAALFPEKEYIRGFSLQCTLPLCCCDMVISTCRANKEKRGKLFEM